MFPLTPFIAKQWDHKLIVIVSVCQCDNYFHSAQRIYLTKARFHSLGQDHRLCVLAGLGFSPGYDLITVDFNLY